MKKKTISQNVLKLIKKFEIVFFLNLFREVMITSDSRNAKLSKQVIIK